MTSQPSSNSNPPFKTPDPKKLQSEDSKIAVQETLAQEGTDTNVVDEVDEDNILDNSLDLPGFGYKSPPPPAD
ncbi:hypothetical protein [Leptolyngbya sp. FACHB-16]|uniref:hypothetical protein n=1 Tax=unclassified Leptolyngbya TaxID=2650499 RepID=UPI001684BA59|nr:hypothetical protein [Leptolyngbya sp. FACHB-16]MBD2152946.1 hypothetical protein [Leptolyngbya sp. FACHB-16]